MKIRPPEKADITVLLRNLFLRTEQELIKEISKKRMLGQVEYAEVIALERVQRILQNMVDTSWSYVPAMIEKIFYHSDKDATGYANARDITGTHSASQIAIMEQLANNLQGELMEMAGTAKKSVEKVFTIARLENDPYRKLALEEILRQEASGKPWIKSSQDLVKEMETNGITGFTDKAGRKWSMQAYGNMAVRTTARQAEVAALLTSDEYDLWQNDHYKKCRKIFDQYMRDTNTSSAPWYIIDASDRKWAELQVLETMIGNIEIAMENSKHSVPILQNVFPLVEMPKLNEIPLEGKEVEEEQYKAELKELQAKLGSLHNRLYRKRVPVIITYEGWDAAGKGGNIKRITEALDPRGFEVHPIASPEPHEKARHYLWRFWTRLPKNGHIAIFDRTWYGRVMVERLEGFCSENDWRRAYNEINEFEKELSDWGAVIVKFWVQIDKDTQLARFNDRQNNPEKRWKITDEDWRNREKWDQYEVAVDEMLQKTSTTYAPWHILESVDKKYARLKALRIVIEEIEKALK